MVQQASKSSVELFTNLYFKDRIVKEEGFIFRIHKNGFVVFLTYDSKENK